jgi:hypothetical protein
MTLDALTNAMSALALLAAEPLVPGSRRDILVNQVEDAYHPEDHHEKKDYHGIRP